MSVSAPTVTFTFVPVLPTCTKQPPTSKYSLSVVNVEGLPHDQIHSLTGRMHDEGFFSANPNWSQRRIVIQDMDLNQEVTVRVTAAAADPLKISCQESYEDPENPGETLQRDCTHNNIRASLLDGSYVYSLYATDLIVQEGPSDFEELEASFNASRAGLDDLDETDGAEAGPIGLGVGPTQV